MSASECLSSPIVLLGGLAEMFHTPVLPWFACESDHQEFARFLPVRLPGSNVVVSQRSLWLPSSAVLPRVAEYGPLASLYMPRFVLLTIR